MTNAEIIMRESLSLVEQGILASHMEEVTDMNGEEVEMAVPEEIHTFDYWKDEAGRCVKYGEHAIAKFAIWSPTKASRKEMAEAKEKGEKPKIKMRMRTTSFFKFDQTETLEEAKKHQKERQEAKKKESREKYEKAFDKACAKVQAENEAEKPKTAKKSKATEPVPARTVPKAKEPKNPYKTLIAAFHKAVLKKNLGKRKLYYRRQGDYVYICDSGWYMKRVSVTDFDKYFVEAKDYYVSLKDGEGYAVENLKIEKSYQGVTGMDFKGIFDKSHRGTSKCEVLDYTEQNKDGDTVRAIKCGTNYISVNDAYLKALGETSWEGSTPVDAIVTETAILLPTRHDKDFVERVEKSLKR